MTNSIPIPDEKQFGKLKVLSIAPLIASALRAVFEDTSVSEIFGRREPGLIARTRLDLGRDRAAVPVTHLAREPGDQRVPA